LLGFLADRFPAITTNDDMMTWGKANGEEFTRHTIRAQLWGWSNREYVERIADGQYRITPKGAAAIGRTLSGEGKEGPASIAGPSLKVGGG